VGDTYQLLPVSAELASSTPGALQALTITPTKHIRIMRAR
jgi:hypothetical protein